MGVRPKGRKTVDPIAGRRLLGACWLAARWGTVTLQLRLLAQLLLGLPTSTPWRYQGTLIAGIGIVWMCGQLLGRRYAERATALAWGIWLLGSAVAWLSLVNAPAIANSALRLGASSLLAILLALFSSAWVRRPRPWPTVSSGAVQVSGLAGILAGLCVNWLLPDWSGAVGVGLLLPLLLLDLWPASRSPQPANALAWLQRWPGRDSSQDFLQLGQGIMQSVRPGWWWSWLASSGQLSSTLLRRGGAVIATSMGSVVPTLYAWQLARAQSLEKLPWLLCGQLVALLLFCGALRLRAIGWLIREGARAARSPAPRPLFLAGCGVLVLSAICMAALGNPWQQGPWFLALALGGYTFALALWQRFDPQELPGGTSAPTSARRWRPWILSTPGSEEELTRIRLVRDDYARRCASRWETLLLLAATLLTGIVSDLWGIATALVLAGGALSGWVAFVLLAARATDRWVDSEEHLPDVQEASVYLAGGAPATDTLHPLPSAHPTSARLFEAGEPREGSEPRTTTHYPVLVPQAPGEASPGRFAAQFSHLQADDEEGGPAHEPNGNGIR